MRTLKTLALAAFALFSLYASAQNEHVTIQGDHSELDAVIELPVGLKKASEKVPMVVLCHGFTGSKEGTLFDQIADSLTARGFAILRFDFNGHGKSGGRFQDMTVPNEIEDAKRVVDYAGQLPYVGDIILCGHSQGGVVSAMTSAQLGKDRIKAVVLLAPAAVLRDDALRGNTFGTTYDPKNPPEVIPIYNNLLLGGEYIRTATSLPIYETARTYDGAELIVHGDADRIVPYTYGQRFHYLNPNSQWILMDSADHMFSGMEKQVAHEVAQFLVQTFRH